MSDPGDPMDKAYVEAEAVLHDEAARAARRARVLGAVAREPATPAAAAPSATRRPAWRPVRWLAAACVAGFGVLVISQIYRPAEHLPRVAAGLPAAQPSAAPPATVVVSAAPSTPAPSTSPPAPPASIAPPVAAPIPLAKAAPPPPPPAIVAAPAPRAFPAEAAPPPPPPPPPQDVVVTSERRERDEATADQAARAPATQAAAGFAAPPPAPPASVGALAGLPPDRGASLRAAAAAGRSADIEGLLAQGVPVDAPDTAGDTALMRAIQADQPAAAALLRHHGASPDRKNKAGQSARDMARDKDDPALDRAVGVSP